MKCKNKKQTLVMEMNCANQFMSEPEKNYKGKNEEH